MQPISIDSLRGVLVPHFKIQGLRWSDAEKMVIAIAARLLAFPKKPCRSRRNEEQPLTFWLTPGKEAFVVDLFYRKLHGKKEHILARSNGCIIKEGLCLKVVLGGKISWKPIVVIRPLDQEAVVLRHKEAQQKRLIERLESAGKQWLYLAAPLEIRHYSSNKVEALQRRYIADLENVIEKSSKHCLPLTSGEIAGYMRNLLDALDTLHSLGFLHQDVKPANLLLDDDGQCYLGDLEHMTVQLHSVVQKHRYWDLGAQLGIATPMSDLVGALHIFLELAASCVKILNWSDDHFWVKRTEFPQYFENLLTPSSLRERVKRWLWGSSDQREVLLGKLAPVVRLAHEVIRKEDELLEILQVAALYKFSGLLPEEFNRCRSGDWKRLAIEVNDTLMKKVAVVVQATASHLDLNNESLIVEALVQSANGLGEYAIFEPQGEPLRILAMYDAIKQILRQASASSETRRRLAKVPLEEELYDLLSSKSSEQRVAGFKRLEELGFPTARSLKARIDEYSI